MSEQPTCGKCGRAMTPANSTAAPEYFLCDICALSKELGFPEREPLTPLNTPRRSTISRFTVGRLYNLGNYEHVRYELTVDVPEGCSVEAAFTRTLKLLKAVSPRPPVAESDYDRAKLMLAKPSETLTDWDKENIPSYRERVEKHEKWKRNRELALKSLDALGAASETKDAKLSWEDDYNDDYGDV